MIRLAADINMEHLWLDEYWEFDNASLEIRSKDQAYPIVSIAIQMTKQLDEYMDDIREAAGLLPMFRRNADGAIDEDGWYNGWLVVSAEDETLPTVWVECAVESPEAEDDWKVYRIELTEKQQCDALEAIGEELWKKQETNLREIFAEARELMAELMAELSGKHESGEPSQ